MKFSRVHSRQCSHADDQERVCGRKLLPAPRLGRWWAPRQLFDPCGTHPFVSTPRTSCVSHAAAEHSICICFFNRGHGGPDDWLERQDDRIVMSELVATQDGAVRLRLGPSGRHSGSPGKEGSPSNFADVRDSIGPRMFMITGRSELPDGECLRLLAVVRVRDGGSEQVQSKMREGGRKMRALDLAQV